MCFRARARAPRVFGYVGVGVYMRGGRVGGGGMTGCGGVGWGGGVGFGWCGVVCVCVVGGA